MHDSVISLYIHVIVHIIMYVLIIIMMHISYRLQVHIWNAVVNNNIKQSFAVHVHVMELHDYPSPTLYF